MLLEGGLQAQKSGAQRVVTRLPSERVTVIIRSCQRQTLDHALTSLAHQSHSYLEVLIVNALATPHATPKFDSQDADLKILEFSGQRLSRSAAANLGLGNVTGQFVLFLDDDDWLEPCHIENLLSVLQGQTENTIAAYSATRCVDEVGNSRDETFGVDFDQTRLLSGNFIPIHSCLFRWTAQTQYLRMDETLDLYEDWDFWMQLSMHGGFIFSPLPTAIYRLGSGSGFGVDGWGSEVAAKAYARVLAKWRLKWTDVQLERILERARLSFL